MADRSHEENQKKGKQINFEDTSYIKHIYIADVFKHFSWDLLEGKIFELRC